MTKKKREIYKQIQERRKFTTNTADIKRIMRKYYEQ